MSRTKKAALIVGALALAGVVYVGASLRVFPHRPQPGSDHVNYL